MSFKKLRNHRKFPLLFNKTTEDHKSCKKILQMSFKPIVLTLILVIGIVSLRDIFNS